MRLWGLGCETCDEDKLEQSSVRRREIDANQGMEGMKEN